MHATAAELTAQGVVTVRERAATSNADATRYPREWKATQAHSEPSAEVPDVETDAATSAVLSVWETALTTARAEHDAAIAAATTAVNEAQAAATAHASALNDVQAELRRTRERYQAELARLEADLSRARPAREHAQTERDQALAEAGTARGARERERHDRRPP